MGTREAVLTCIHNIVFEQKYENSQKNSTENCHFYSHEKSLYIAWACFRNVRVRYFDNIQLLFVDLDFMQFSKRLSSFCGFTGSFVSCMYLVGLCHRKQVFSHKMSFLISVKISKS